MSWETRKKILEKARDLWNREGTEKITTRHIAAQLGMSQGNLHYHFPKKTELIWALYENLKGMTQKVQRYQSGRMALEDIRDSLKDHFLIMDQFRFLFQDREYVWRQVPRIERETKAFLFRKRRQFIQVLVHLHLGGGEGRQKDKREIEILVDQVIVLVVGWMAAREFVGQKEDPPTYFSELVFLLIQNHLK